METKIIRVAQGKQSTLSQLYINGVFQCYLLEDKIRTEKIKEQRNKILNSKSDIEKNITGTPELLAVSEAQKLRLDKQIEQFEELQKRLLSL